MFTGIIESLGEVVTLLSHDDILEMTIKSPISGELEIDQSVNHDGVCLTVVHSTDTMHRVQLVEETCRRTTFKSVKAGDLINLERAMPANGRFEGHIVQGHVDCTGELISNEQAIFRFRYPPEYALYLVEKGSIAVNGVSLTIAALSDETFDIAIIPHTLAYTNLQFLEPGSLVNLEFDILGKYLMKHIRMGREEMLRT